MDRTAEADQPRMRHCDGSVSGMGEAGALLFAQEEPKWW